MVTARMGRAESLAWVALAYAVALGMAAVIIDGWAGQLAPLVLLAWADGAATFLIFGFSVTFNNSSLYDPYWSVIPPGIALYWWVLAPPDANGVRAAVVGLLVTAWAVRLTYNWARGWNGIGQEDWRYVDLRRQSGATYWLVSLFGIHAFPTVLVFAGCLALEPAMTRPSAIGFADGLAWALIMVAVVIEATADAQLHRFKQTNSDPHATLTDGLWGWCRHPNYFGEWLFWVGVFVAGWAADPQAWWTLAGPLLMLLLFLFISIPMIDRRMLKRRIAYAVQIRNVPAFFPRPPRPES